jgi:5'-nucleotidase
MQHGSAYFSRLVDESKLKAVATNYYNQGLLNDVVLPYRIIRKGAVKIGIIGIGTDKAKELNPTGSSHLVTLMNNTAATLKQQHNCKVVICLSHLSLKG